MKTRRVRVSFEKTIDITLYAPESMSLDQIEELAEEAARGGLRDWDEPEWFSSVFGMEVIEIPDGELRRGEPNKYGFKPIIEGSRLRREDVLVVNDEQDDIVSPEDASWWEVNNNKEDE